MLENVFKLYQLSINSFNDLKMKVQAWMTQTCLTISPEEKLLLLQGEGKFYNYKL